MIIAIAGHNKIGKSTLAKWLKEEYTRTGKTAEIYSFAQTLRYELYQQFDKEWLEKKSNEARRLFRAWGDARRAQNSMYFVTPLLKRLSIMQDTKDHIAIIDDVYHVNEFFNLNLLPNVKNIFIQKTFHKVNDEDFVFDSVRQTEVVLGFNKHKNMEILLDVDRNIEYTTQELANFVKNTQDIYLVEHILTDYPTINIYMQKCASRFISSQGE